MFCPMGTARQVRHHSNLLQDRVRENVSAAGVRFFQSVGEWTEVEHEAWSTALVVVHVGTGLCVSFL